jgi:hypothetical protein
MIITTIVVVVVIVITIITTTNVYSMPFSNLSLFISVTSSLKQMV